MLQNTKTTVRAKTPEQLEAIARAGFDGTDISMAYFNRCKDVLSGDFEKELFERFDILKGLGLTVGQTHLTYWPSHIEQPKDLAAYEEHLLPVLKKELELTAQMGCAVAVMHPYFIQDGKREESREGNLRIINALLPTAQRHKVTLALENIYGHNSSDAHHERPEDMLYYTERFDCPELGICLDTGHACIRGSNPVEMVRAFGKHLKALHLHSCVNRLDSHLLPCVTVADPIDWQALFAALDETGYSGNINLEIGPHPALAQSALDAYYRLAYDIVCSLTNISS